MTNAQPDLPVLAPTPVAVKPKANSKLAQLHAEYEAAKSAAKAAGDHFKAITDAIKFELSQASGGDQTRVELQPANGVEAPALALSYVESWTLDSKRLKAEHPEIWVGYARKGGSWRLAPIKDGGGEE